MVTDFCRSNDNNASEEKETLISYIILVGITIVLSSMVKYLPEGPNKHHQNCTDNHRRISTSGKDKLQPEQLIMLYVVISMNVVKRTRALAFRDGRRSCLRKEELSTVE